MIHLSAAGKRYAHKLLFENVDWLITAQDRVGLVGAVGPVADLVAEAVAEAQDEVIAVEGDVGELGLGVADERLALLLWTNLGPCARPRTGTAPNSRTRPNVRPKLIQHFR